MTGRRKPSRRRLRKEGKSSASRFRRRAVHVPEGCLAVGRILGAHGLYGEVKVESYTDFEERFDVGQRLLMGEELASTEVEGARPHKGVFLLRFHGVEDRTAAESLHGEWLYIREQEAMELDEESFWVHDIIGLSVQTESLRQLGKIVDVLFTGANEVYVVDPRPGVNRDRDLLIPALAEVVRAVDLGRGMVTVRLLPGILEEEEA